MPSKPTQPPPASGAPVNPPKPGQGVPIAPLHPAGHPPGRSQQQ